VRRYCGKKATNAPEAVAEKPQFPRPKRAKPSPVLNLYLAKDLIQSPAVRERGEKLVVAIILTIFPHQGLHVKE